MASRVRTLGSETRGALEVFQQETKIYDCLTKTAVVVR